ncbi:hypothetical protein LCGC14_2177860, partial [marine sediment metagenome]
MQSQAAENEVLASTQGAGVAGDGLSDYEKYRLSIEGEYDASETNAGLEGYVMEDTNYYPSDAEMQYAYYDDGSQPAVVNNYYGAVNQYPSYESRINRFHSPSTGYGYYDPWYDPYYGSGGSRFSVSMGFGMGFGM